MRTNGKSEDVNHGHRRLIGAAAVTLTAAPLGLVRSTSGTAAPLAETKPGTNTSFAALKQINAGLLNVGNAEAGPPTDRRSSCCTAGLTTSTVLSTSRRCWPPPATG
jgi:hypothetical protein